MRDFRDEYWEEIISKKNDFTIRNRYYYTGELKELGQFFPGNGSQKGIWKNYNIKGEVIEEINYDKPFEDYPWEKVKKYLEERNVDLKDNYTRVWREENKDGVFWMISWDAQKLSNIGTKTITNIIIDVKQKKLSRNIQQYTKTIKGKLDSINKCIQGH